MMILITGGIGSGKSVVSAILRAQGYDVYDCDREARRLMDNDAEIKRRIRSEICAEAIDADGNINRAKLAGAVFSDEAGLAALNRMVHGAVRTDILSRMKQNTVLFVETAIPVSGGLVGMSDRIWQVDAPEELRICRVMRRNGISADDVRARINAQRNEAVSPTEVIVNDGVRPLLPRILGLLQALPRE